MTCRCKDRDSGVTGTGVGGTCQKFQYSFGWFAAMAHRYTAGLSVPDSGEMSMLQRLLFGLIAVTSLTLVGCAHSPQQLNPEPKLNAQLAPVGHGSRWWYG